MSGSYVKKVLQEILLLVIHGNSKQGWLPNVPYVDTVSLYLNCGLEGMNERKVRQQTSGVCTPVRTMPVKRVAWCCPS